MRDRLTNKPRGFGFITFKEQEAADNACNDTHTLDGRTVGAAAAAATEAAVQPNMTTTASSAKLRDKHSL
jgi:hypothetical protein